MICPACGSERHECPLIEQHDTAYRDTLLQYAIRECEDCRSQFADPMSPAPPTWYADQGEYYEWRWEFSLFQQSLARWQAQVPGCRLLEIGCGEGILLDRLQSNGVKITGLEMNESAAHLAKKKGLPVHGLSLDQFYTEYPHSRYDAIAFFQVLEHQSDPLSFLQTVSRVLRPHGTIYLSVPNPDRYQLLVERESWDYPPHHLMRFSKQGLTTLLNRAGFRIRQMIDRPYAAEDHTQAAKQLYTRYPLPKRIRQLLKLPLMHLMQRRVARWSCSGQDLYLWAEREGDAMAGEPDR
jgi:2-polyprenyl-3-methyl-5-hydroxy-6-metoxy-1,4-benzoquinol methylase